VPAGLGGLQAEPATGVSVVETLARADGAAGWCVAIAATSGLLAAYLDQDAARAPYGSPGAMVAGVFAPLGRATPEGADFRVTGRWPFASGCEHCDWLMGGCVVGDADDDLRRLPNGAPDTRLMLVPRAQVEILDTWHVTGLRGTGSNDIVFDGLLVAGALSASVFSDRPVVKDPLYAFPLFGLLAVAIAGVSLGVARGALDDLLELAGAKTPSGATRKLAERATVQAEAARADAELRAARALLYESIAAAWEQAQAEGTIEVDLRAGLRVAATHAAHAGATVSATAYRLGGGSAIYETSPLQRRFRDANVATQHILVAPRTWELTGRLLMGLPTDVTQL
jgi:indole-3-acetate monooxygenase